MPLSSSKHGDKHPPIRSVLTVMCLLMVTAWINVQRRSHLRQALSRRFHLLQSSSASLKLSKNAYVYHRLLRVSTTTLIPSCFAWTPISLSHNVWRFGSRNDLDLRHVRWQSQPFISPTGKRINGKKSYSKRYLSSPRSSKHADDSELIVDYINFWTVTTIPFSDYADHVEIGNYVGGGLVSDDSPKDQNFTPASSLTVVNAIDYVIQRQQQKHEEVSGEWLTPLQLLYLGAVWYLPADEYHEQRAQHREDLLRECIGRKSTRSNNNRGVKPRRLEVHHATDLELRTGDYLRIHHTPRRFPTVHEYLWNGCTQEGQKANGSQFMEASDRSDTERRYGSSRGIIVFEDEAKGFLVINKPPMVPVHSTVDNAIENVVYQIQHATSISATTEQQSQATSPSTSLLSSLSKADADNLPAFTSSRDYVSTTHRMDVNTSGLLIVATTKPFAAYFAKLLRYKTEQEVRTNRIGEVQSQHSPILASNSAESAASGIFKCYKCLVCVLEPSSPSTNHANANNTYVRKEHERRNNAWSIEQSIQELHSCVTENSVIRHYLEASPRSPKRFEPSIPLSTKETGASSKNGTKAIDWLECLLQIRRVGSVYPVIPPTQAVMNEDYITSSDDCRISDSSTIGVASQKQQDLLRSLWPSQSVCRPPPNLRAVVELEIHLITGRTHQIRGQLACMGYPIVGDEQYGGAIPVVPNGVNGASTCNMMSLSNIELSSTSDSPLPQLLALQCCELGFWDPDFRSNMTENHEDVKDLSSGQQDSRRHRRKKQKKSSNQTVSADDVGVLSSRWNQFRLESSAWWTPFLNKYRS